MVTPATTPADLRRLVADGVPGLAPYAKQVAGPPWRLVATGRRPGGGALDVSTVGLLALHPPVLPHPDAGRGHRLGPRADPPARRAARDGRRRRRAGRRGPCCAARRRGRRHRTQPGRLPRAQPGRGADDHRLAGVHGRRRPGRPRLAGRAHGAARGPRVLRRARAPRAARCRCSTCPARPGCPTSTSGPSGAASAVCPTTTDRVRNFFGGAAAVRRELFVELGGFSTELGHSGRFVGGGEEALFCQRATQKTGGTFLFVPTPIQEHHMPPSRLTWRYLVRRCFGEGVMKRRLQRLLPGDQTLGEERAFAYRLPLQALGHVARGRPGQAVGIVVATAGGARRPRLRDGRGPAPGRLASVRVLQLTQLYPPVIGGEERHVRNLSTALAGRGHEVHVATFATDAGDAAGRPRRHRAPARQRGPAGAAALPRGRPAARAARARPAHRARPGAA